MKALRIAFFACVLSVFFCFTAYADNNINLTIPYLDTTTAVESWNTTISASNGFTAGDVYAFNVNVTYGQPIGHNYNGGTFPVNNLQYTAHFSIIDVRAGEGVSVSFSGNRVYVQSEYVNFQNSIPITIIYSVTGSWTRGIQIVDGYAQPLDNCYLSLNTTLSISDVTYLRDGNSDIIPSELKYLQYLQQIDGKLDDLLNKPPPDFLGDDALFYFDERYFNSLYLPNGNAVLSENGYWTVNYSSSGKMLLDFFNENKDGSGGRPVSGLLEPGTYYGVISIPALMSLENIAFEHIPASYYDVEIFPYNDANGYRFIPFVIDVKQHIAFNGIILNFGTPAAPLQNAIIYGGIAPVNPDYLAGEALNPDQEINRDELENQGEQQSQQESQLWQNVNTYKSQLDFNLSGWNEATSGLSYVSSIFMLIWNNSPRQIITLSLMLGIGMLAIGRGVKAAVRQKDGDG